MLTSPSAAGAAAASAAGASVVLKRRVCAALASPCWRKGTRVTTPARRVEVVTAPLRAAVAAAVGVLFTQVCLVLETKVRVKPGWKCVCM
jgi:hypothetical protein